MTDIRSRTVPVIPAFLGLAVILTLTWLMSPEIVRAASEIVPASECTVPERTQSELVSIVSSAIPASPDTGVTTAGTELTDVAVVEAVSKVVRLSVACANANAPLRSLSLFSDQYVLRRFGAEPQDDIGHLFASISRTPGPVEQRDLLSLDSVGNFVLLADGRVSVTVVTSNSSGVFVDRLILISIDEKWLIDEVVLDAGGGTPTPAS